jgi:hypothetical protein
MLCPNCGTKTTTRHKFCRNCGMNLEPVSRALTEHLSADGAASAASAREGERRALRRLTNGLLVGVIIIMLGVLMAVFLPGKGGKFLGVAATLVGLVAALAAVLSPLRALGTAVKEPAPRPLDGAPGPSTGPLLHEQTFEHAPSTVTDHTTELLNVEFKDRKPRD